MSKNVAARLTHLSEKWSKSMDLRGSVRHLSEGHVAVCLRWNDGDEDRTTDAEIVNISATGALLEVDDGPTTGQTVWLRADGDKPSDWVEASVVEDEQGQRLSRCLRLAFRDTCSYTLFTAAVKWFKS